MNDVLTLPPNSLVGRGIGDNHPPLQEILAEELAADRERAADLLASAKAARIENARSRSQSAQRAARRRIAGGEWRLWSNAPTAFCRP
jgi:hypothetical protein